MKVHSIFLCLSLIQGALSHVVQERNGPDSCNADNCARAVTGTAAFKTPVAVRRADCSSFQKTVVTPPVVTVTDRVTVTLPPFKRAVIEARQITAIPTAIPTYASACSGSVRYKSACSCWGITPTIVTAPTPTTTITITTTVSLGCSSPGICGTFNRIEDPSCGPVGDCTCAHDVNGKAVCVEDVVCAGAKLCNADADCGKGGICWDQNCCSQKICTVPSTLCANPNHPKRWFRRAADEAKRGGLCSATGCD